MSAYNSNSNTDAPYPTQRSSAGQQAGIHQAIPVHIPDQGPPLVHHPAPTEEQLTQYSSLANWSGGNPRATNFSPPSAWPAGANGKQVGAASHGFKDSGTSSSSLANRNGGNPIPTSFSPPIGRQPGSGTSSDHPAASEGSPGTSSDRNEYSMPVELGDLSIFDSDKRRRSPSNFKFDDWQKVILCDFYTRETASPDYEQIRGLSEQLGGVSETSIETWFYAKRRKDRVGIQQPPRARILLNEGQQARLEKAFKENPFLPNARSMALARELDLSERAVATRFKEGRMRKQSGR
ncbi:hypothetical protein C8Q76DRAFT_790387 [Earliella scabrosa]|nr:hypothetical protein C8Q76DRAFT_790387 [Earliella scabrosa]